jgi:flagellar secretion chaperone FliS
MSHEKYLEHEILSAPPQKLQLLLIDAALRHGHRAKNSWGDNNEEAARRAIEQMQAIVMQLLNGLAADNSQPLVRRVAAVYAFLVRELAKAHLQRDQESLDGVIRVLQIERETWWQVCQQMGTSSNSASAAPHFAKTPETATASTFSLDA